MSSDTKSRSEFEVAQEIKGLLEAVASEKREMVLRWACEAVGLPTHVASGAAHQPPAAPDARHPGDAAAAAPATGQAPRPDLKNFVNEKQPKSDVQFAVVVAYFHRFEAPPERRKNVISADDLQDATRLAGRSRFKTPSVPLNNAVGMGYLDRGDERGTYKLNPVGENLVAMALAGKPEGSSITPTRAARRPTVRRSRTPKASAKTSRGKKR